MGVAGYMRCNVCSFARLYIQNSQTAISEPFAVVTGACGTSALTRCVTPVTPCRCHASTAGQRSGGHCQWFEVNRVNRICLLFASSYAISSHTGGLQYSILSSMSYIYELVFMNKGAPSDRPLQEFHVYHRTQWRWQV